MDKKPKTRPLPKKTIIYIFILVILAIFTLFIVQDGRARKATEVLYALGFTNVSDVIVFTRSEFMNESTNIKGFKYSVKFTDNINHQDCQGFALRDFKGNVAKDFTCTKKVK